MPAFQSRPLNPSKFNTAVKRHPAYFGVPFVLIIVAASFGLSAITQTRFDFQDQRMKQVGAFK